MNKLFEYGDRKVLYSVISGARCIKCLGKTSKKCKCLLSHIPLQAAVREETNSNKKKFFVEKLVQSIEETPIKVKKGKLQASMSS